MTKQSQPEYDFDFFKQKDNEINTTSSENKKKVTKNISRSLNQVQNKVKTSNLWVILATLGVTGLILNIENAGWVLFIAILQSTSIKNPFSIIACFIALLLAYMNIPHAGWLIFFVFFISDVGSNK